MRISTLWPALLLVVPTLASGQQQPAVKPPFEVMKANASAIRNMAEKERWMANVDLWEIALAPSGAVDAKDRARMDALLERIRINVARIRSAPEKARWETNIQMWQALIAGNGLLSKTEAAKLGPMLDSLKANIADISIASEHERWQANRELWEGVLARSTAAD